MNTIRKVPVTLTHEEADVLVEILRDHAAALWGQARRTRHADVREDCTARGNAAAHLADQIVRRTLGR